MFAITLIVSLLAVEQPDTLATSASRAQIPHLTPVIAAQFTPDGLRVITATTRGTLRVSALKNGKTILERPTCAGGGRALAMSPDGRSIAIADENGRVHVFDAEELKLRFIIDALPSPESKTSRVRNPVGIDIDINVARKDQKAGPTLVEAVAFAPDGSTFLTVATDAFLRTYDAATGRLRSTKRYLESRPLRAARPSPGGKYVLLAVADG
jgi:WD40 repeat protein